MTAVEFRRLAARFNLLRARVELEATCERDQKQRAVLEQACELLVECERVLVVEASAAP